MTNAVSAPVVTPAGDVAAGASVDGFGLRAAVEARGGQSIYNRDGMLKELEGLSNPDRSNYVQNFALKTLNFENRKTLVVCLDNETTLKCMPFAPLWRMLILFILTSRTSAIIAMLL